MLTSAEVAEYLKLNPQTVRNMIDRGQLRSVRIGAPWSYPSSELDRFITAGDAQDADAPSVTPMEPAKELAAVLSEAARAAEADDPSALIATVRNLAATAARLADALKKRGL